MLIDMNNQLLHLNNILIMKQWSLFYWIILTDSTNNNGKKIKTFRINNLIQMPNCCYEKHSEKDWSSSYRWIIFEKRTCSYSKHQIISINYHPIFCKNNFKLTINACHFLLLFEKKCNVNGKCPYRKYVYKSMRPAEGRETK